MMRFELPTGAALERAREAYAECEAADVLLRRTERTGPRVSASQIYAAATTGESSVFIEGLLAASPSARAFLRRVVSANALFTMPEAIAASTAMPLARHGDGCRIRVERSRAEPDQFFVVVELARQGEAAPPKSLVVCDAEDRCVRFPLPTVRNGIAQLIADSDSVLLRLIGDPTTRVYLQ